MVLRPNKKLIHEVFGFSKPDAAQWVRLMHAAEKGGHDDVDQVLAAWDKETGGFGVEAIQCERQVDRYYYDINLLYVNQGDTYRNTLMFDTYESKFYLGGWGDWVEWMERKHGEGWCP